LVREPGEKALSECKAAPASYGGWIVFVEQLHRLRNPRARVAFALSVAFAWGPALDLIETLLRACRGLSGAGEIALGIAAFVARAAIGRFVFGDGGWVLGEWRSTIASGRFWAALALAVATFALGVVLRMALLVPLLGEALRVQAAGAWIVNAVVPPGVIAAYAVLLPLALPKKVNRGHAPDPAPVAPLAALWAAVGQGAIVFDGLWENEWSTHGIGLGWHIRWWGGVVLPFVAGWALEIAAWRDRAGSTTHEGTWWSRFRVAAKSPSPSGTAILAWMVVPLAAVVLYFLADGLSFLCGINPVVVTAARAPDGMRAVIVAQPDDPYDVFLCVEDRDHAWSRYRVAYADPPWGQEVAFLPGTHDVLVQAFGIDVAVLHERTQTLEKLAPLTGCVPTPISSQGPF
jgi:hypothetical protein